MRKWMWIINIVVNSSLNFFLIFFKMKRFTCRMIFSAKSDDPPDAAPPRDELPDCESGCWPCCSCATDRDETSRRSSSCFLASANCLEIASTLPRSPAKSRSREASFSRVCLTDCCASCNSFDSWVYVEKRTEYGRRPKFMMAILKTWKKMLSWVYIFFKIIFHCIILTNLPNKLTLDICSILIKISSGKVVSSETNELLNR